MTVFLAGWIASVEQYDTTGSSTHQHHMRGCHRYVATGLLTLPTIASAQQRNVAHERLVAMPEAGRARLLGAAVGPECKGTRAFHMGTGDTGLSKGKS
jgi:hypothetical protein